VKGIIMRRELERQQAEVLEVLDKLDRLMAHCGPDQIVALGETRVGFGELLHQHAVFKEQVYALIREGGCPEADRIVGRSRSRMMALVVAYRLHGADWTPRAMLKDWPCYLEASRALIARVRRQIAEDRIQLYPLLDGGDGDAVGWIAAPGDAVVLAAQRALASIVEPGLA
jgi:hypothetical protein